MWNTKLGAFMQTILYLEILDKIQTLELQFTRELVEDIIHHCDSINMR
jgi:hypothetical protein